MRRAHLVTREAIVAEDPKKDSAPAMPGGGMGGMDYGSDPCCGDKEKAPERSGAFFVWDALSTTGSNSSLPPVRDVQLVLAADTYGMLRTGVRKRVCST